MDVRIKFILTLISLLSKNSNRCFRSIDKNTRIIYHIDVLDTNISMPFEFCASLVLTIFIQYTACIEDPLSMTVCWQACGGSGHTIWSKRHNMCKHDTDIPIMLCEAFEASRLALSLPTFRCVSLILASYLKKVIPYWITKNSLQSFVTFS